jgi:hypothetical protein
MRTIATTILLLTCLICIGAQRLIIVDGNSISANSTSGIVTNRWSDVLQRSLGTNTFIVTNFAVSAQNLHDMTNDYPTQIKPLATNNGLQTVYIPWELVNTWRAASGGTGTDAASNMTGPEAANMYSNVCARAKADGFIVFAGDDFHHDYPYETLEASNIIKTNWPTYANALIEFDLQALLDDANANDGLHLGDTGEAIAAGAVETTIRNYFGSYRVFNINNAHIGKINKP